MLIMSELINTNLTIQEKVNYVKARCMLSQLNYLNNKERENFPKNDIHNLFLSSEKTIKTLNVKMGIIETDHIY